MTISVAGQHQSVRPSGIAERQNLGLGPKLGRRRLSSYPHCHSVSAGEPRHVRRRGPLASSPRCLSKPGSEHRQPRLRQRRSHLPVAVPQLKQCASPAPGICDTVNRSFPSRSLRERDVVPRGVLTIIESRIFSSPSMSIRATGPLGDETKACVVALLVMKDEPLGLKFLYLDELRPILFPRTGHRGHHSTENQYQCRPLPTTI